MPVTRSLFEPLCAVYPVGALPCFVESATHGQWKLQGTINILLAQRLLVTESLLPEERDMFFNLNSLEDLAVLNAP